MKIRVSREELAKFGIKIVKPTPKDIHNVPDFIELEGEVVRQNGCCSQCEVTSMAAVKHNNDCPCHKPTEDECLPCARGEDHYHSDPGPAPTYRLPKIVELDNFSADYIEAPINTTRDRINELIRRENQRNGY